MNECDLSDAITDTVAGALMWQGKGCILCEFLAIILCLAFVH